MVENNFISLRLLISLRVTSLVREYYTDVTFLKLSSLFITRIYPEINFVLGTSTPMGSATLILFPLNYEYAFTVESHVL